MDEMGKSRTSRAEDERSSFLQIVLPLSTAAGNQKPLKYFFGKEDTCTLKAFFPGVVKSSMADTYTSAKLPSAEETSKENITISDTRG